jgi:hypothetical protein
VGRASGKPKLYWGLAKSRKAEISESQFLGRCWLAPSDIPETIIASSLSPHPTPVILIV